MPLQIATCLLCELTGNSLSKLRLHLPAINYYVSIALLWRAKLYMSGLIVRQNASIFSYYTCGVGSTRNVRIVLPRPSKAACNCSKVTSMFLVASMKPYTRCS